MIVVNGIEYRTPEQELYANGERVLSAWANGKLVYPERENTWLCKIVGQVNRIVTHDHTADDPSCGDYNSTYYLYHGGGSYRAHGAFSMVFRFHVQYGNKFSQLWVHPSYSTATIAVGTGNNPTTGGGVHPLWGDTMQAKMLSKTGTTGIYSAELLLYLDVSAPPVCPFYCNDLRINRGTYWDEIYEDAEAVPLHDHLESLPSDVNGWYRAMSYQKNTYYGVSWMLTGPSGKRFNVRAAGEYRWDYTGPYISHLAVSTTSKGYEVPYAIHSRTGETEYTYQQAFPILNIPVTAVPYGGMESETPEEHLHPSVADIAAYTGR